MPTEAKTSKKRTSMRESMEVKNGTQGLGRMCRRGLHGAKNWVLEPDENGVHRTVGSKAFRAAVSLAPAWIVMSAFTGSQEGGGQQVGVFQAFFMATLVTVLMLGFFSARERRMGREEPWVVEPSAEKETPTEEVSPGLDESSQAVPQAPVEVSSADCEDTERAAEVLENSQVSEVTTGVTAYILEDNEDEKDHFDYYEPKMVTPAVTEAVTQALPVTVQDEVFDQVSDQVTAPEEAVTQVVTPAVTQPEKEIEYSPFPDILDEEAPTVRLGGGHPDSEMVTDSPEELVNEQVNEGDQVVTEEPEKALKVSLEKAPREETSDPEPPVVTPPVTRVVTTGTQEPLFPQVKKVEKAVTPVVTEVVTQPSMATFGPYGQTEDPLSHDWWAVAPDLPEVDPEGVAETTPEGVVEAEEETPEVGPDEAGSQSEEVLVESPEKVSQEAVEPQVTGERVAEESEERLDVTGIEVPDEVMRYLALRNAEDVSKDVKDRARRGAVAWLQREYEAGRLTHRRAARILRVSKTTVTNWLEEEYDPWTVHEEGGGE